MALDPKKLTINYSSLSKLPAQVRNNALNSGLLDNYLKALSPTELANLFPNYYQREAAIPSGFQKAMSGGAGAPSGGGGIPSAIPTSTGGSNRRPVSSAPQVEPNDPIMKFFREQGVHRTPSGVVKSGTEGLGGRNQTMKSVYDAFTNAGFSHKQSLALVAEVGRENSFREKYMFGSHADPHNKAENIGIISMQGSRRRELLKYLESQNRIGPNGIIRDQETLNAMARFIKNEMETTESTKMTKEFLSNPDIDRERAAEILGKGYIRWRYTDPKYRKHHTYRNQFYDQIANITSTYKDKKTLSEINQQGPGTYKSGVSTGFFGGLGSSLINTMSTHAERSKKAGHNVFTSTTLAGYSNKDAEDVARQIIESGDSRVVLNGHSAGGKFAIDVARKLKESGYTGDVQLNLADPAQYIQRMRIPDNVSNVNIVSSGEASFELAQMFLMSVEDRNKTRINDVTVSGVGHVGLAGTSEFEQMMANSLGTTKTEIPLPEEILITPETKQFMDSLTEEQKKVIENSSMSKDQLLSSIQHGINEGKITYDQFGEYLKSTKPRPTATEIKGAIDSQQDPYEFWEARNPRGAILQYGSRRVSRELLTTAMMSAQKFEAEHPGKRVEIYGKKGGIRLGSGTSMHKQDGAIDLAIFEVDRDGNYIDMGGSHKNYPNIPIHKGGKKGSAAAAHLYDRLNEDIELARVYKHSVEGDTNYGYGTRIGTYFGDVTYDQMHTDIKAKLNELGISDQVNPKTGSVAYGMTENWLRNYGIDPSSPEGQELLTGVAEKYGGTKEGIIQASIEAYGPQQQEELSDINQPDLPTQETTEQNSAVPDVKPEPKPEPKPESETEIPKALGTGDQPIQVGTPDTGKAVLTTEKGETYQIGENQAEKIHIESKYNPDMISSKMDIDTTSENPVVNNNGEKYKPTTQPMQKSQEIDFLPSSMGKESSWSLSQMKHIQNSKFSASGFSGHLNYGSKNQSY